MGPSDKQHFVHMLEGLAASTKGQATAGVFKVYWMALSDLPLADFDKAIERAVSRCEFFPSVKELREFAGHKLKVPVPHYLCSAEDELERQETCNYHREHGPAAVAPDYVAWCRKCKRGKLAAAPRGETRALGEMLTEAGWARGKAVND